MSQSLSSRRPVRGARMVVAALCAIVTFDANGALASGPAVFATMDPLPDSELGAIRATGHIGWSASIDWVREFNGKTTRTNIASYSNNGGLGLSGVVNGSLEHEAVENDGATTWRVVVDSGSIRNIVTNAANGQEIGSTVAATVNLDRGGFTAAMRNSISNVRMLDIARASAHMRR
jgi:hypothetical protein